MVTRLYRTEKDFFLAVKRRLNSIDKLFWFKVNLLNLPGIPDIIGCYRGRLFAWELKREKAYKVSKLQSYYIDKINTSGGLARVVKPSTLDLAFEELLKQPSINSQSAA